MNNPIQPIDNGRFKKNEIVNDMLEFATNNGFGMNEIACREYSNSDRQQFAQLIGCSVDGYGSLSYVDDDNWNAVNTIIEKGLDEKDARIDALQAEIDALRSALQKPMANLFGVHPDDLAGNMQK